MAGFVGQSTMLPLLHSEVEQFVVESCVTPLHHRCATAFSRRTGCPRSGLSAQIVAGSRGSLTRTAAVVGEVMDGPRWSGASERDRSIHGEVTALFSSRREQVLEHFERLLVKGAGVHGRSPTCAGRAWMFDEATVRLLSSKRTSNLSGLDEHVRRLAGPASHERHVGLCQRVAASCQLATVNMATRC